MSSDLNRALRSAGPRDIAPLSLSEVKSRASRWRIQRLVLAGAAACLVIGGAVGAWAAIDLRGGTPTVPVAPDDSVCVEPDHDIALFLFDEVTRSELRHLQGKVRQLRGVDEVVFVSKDAAYDEFRNHYEDQPEFFENLPEDALPASLRLTLAPNASTADARRLIRDARELPGVQDVRRGELSEDCAPGGDARDDRVVVPDLLGLTFRDACENVGEDLELRVANYGNTEDCDTDSVVTNQDPPPGTEVRSGTAVAVTLSSAKEPPNETDQALDGLIIELRLEKDTVRAGATVGSTLIVENPTKKSIVDPQCYLASPTFGIVESVDSQLWQAYVVDCGGRQTIAPGERRRVMGPDFTATDGMDPLQPGSYLAVVELRGRTERLSIPIEVFE